MDLASSLTLLSGMSSSAQALTTPNRPLDMSAAVCLIGYFGTRLVWRRI